jgi:hypothetical protein
MNASKKNAIELKFLKLVRDREAEEKNYALKRISQSFFV